MDYSIKGMELCEFKNIYDRMERDFADGEYPPYDKLYIQLEKGIQKGLLLMEGEREKAYSICAESETNGYMLISFLAVFEEFRGRGLGTALLVELKKLYADSQGIIVEVEKPEEADSSEEKKVREKRIEFYRKAGFYMIPNVEYSIWDIPMHLMALPCKSADRAINENIGNIIYDIYLRLMGKRFIHKMKFRKLV